MRTILIAGAVMCAAAVPLRAQTCLGVAYVAVGDSADAADSTRWLSVDATPVVLRRGATRPETPVSFDRAMGESRRGGERFVAADRGELLPNGTLAPGARLQPGRSLQLRWGCRMYAARLVFRRGARAMTVDLYDGPDHRAITLDRPIPFRPGHWSLSLRPISTRGDSANVAAVRGLTRVRR